MNIMITLVLFIAAACATPSPSWNAQELAQALALYERGEAEAGGEKLEGACEKEIPGACLTLGLPEEIRPDYQLKIKQLETNERETRLLITARAGENLKLLLWDQDNLTLLPVGQQQISESTNAAGEKLVEVTLSKLRAGGDYRLDVYSPEFQLLDSRFFSTLKTEGTSLLLAFSETTTSGVDAVLLWDQKGLEAKVRELKPHFGASLGVNKTKNMDLLLSGPDGSERLRLRGFDIYFIRNEGISTEVEAWLLDHMAKTRRAALLIGEMAWFQTGEKGFPGLMAKMKRQVRAPILFISPLKEETETQVNEAMGLSYQTYEFKLAAPDLKSGLLLKTSLGKIEATLHNKTYQVESK